MDAMTKGGCQGAWGEALHEVHPFTVPPAAMAQQAALSLMSAGNKKISLHNRTN